MADSDDTMVSLWNPGDAPEDLVVTLYFAGGSGHYKVPVHVRAGAEADLDLMELIMMQQPDADGNVMPMEVRQGSAVVSGPKDVTDPIEVSLSLAVFNAATATCSTGCTNCAGFSSLEITDDPFAFPVGTTHQLTATAFYSNGTPNNKTSVATWSSNNTAIATVSGGLVNGVSPGNPNISAFVDLNAVGLACQGMFDENGNPVRCPLNQQFQSSSPGTVQVPTSLKVLSVTTLPTGTSGDFGCKPSGDFGIEVAVRYEVDDQNGSAILSSSMEPQETLTHEVLNGQSLGDPLPSPEDLGPSRISGTSRFTGADGTFLDAPVGFCFAAAFTHSILQQISILMGSQRYFVRSQTFNESSSAQGHGSTTNSADIQKTR